MQSHLRNSKWILTLLCFLVTQVSFAAEIKQISDRAILSVTGTSAPGLERVLIENKNNLKVAISENPEAFSQELDILVKRKLITLLQMYGYKVTFVDDADYVIGLGYHIKSSGSVWEASSGYVPLDWKERGWFQNSIKGLHRYQLSLTMAVYDANRYRKSEAGGLGLSLTDAVWFIEIDSMIRTDSYAKTLDFGLVGGMRLFGKAIINYIDSPRVFAEDKDFQLISGFGAPQSGNQQAQFVQQGDNEKILDGTYDEIWQIFDKFLKEEGIEVYEKSQKNGYFDTSIINEGLFSKKGIADDHISVMFESLPEMATGAYSVPIGYFMVIYLRDLGRNKILIKIQVFSNTYQKSGNDKMQLSSSYRFEPQLIEYITRRIDDGIPGAR